MKAGAQSDRADVLQQAALGAIARRDYGNAVTLMRQAVALKPNEGAHHFNLGSALRHKGELAGAVASYREALRLMPGTVEIYNNLGNTLRETGDVQGALSSLLHAIELNPDYARAHMNIGAVYLDLERFDDAERSLQRALALEPALVDAHALLGKLYRRMNRLEEAAVAYYNAMRTNPGEAAMYLNLGNVMQALNRTPEAIGVYELGRQTAPKSVEILNNLGNAYFTISNYMAAIEVYREALAIRPDYAAAHSNLGAALQREGRLEEAIASYRMALQINPEQDSYNNLGLALSSFGLRDEAIATLRRAIELRPGYIVAHRNLLSAMLYDPKLTPKERWHEHAVFGRKLPRPAVKPVFGNERDPERRIRIGYLSSDFLDHPVSRNITPVLENRDREKVELFAYAELTRSDVTTERLKGYFDHWLVVSGMGDAQLAERIRADRIDILVLLAGHFDNNRPQIAAWRTAPLQVSFHDPATSGIAEMDYLIGDRTLAPRGGPEGFSERVLRLPSFYIHAPFADAPPVSPLPADTNGYVTFCSFSNPAKLNNAVLSLWAEVLRAVPTARLSLKFKSWFKNRTLRERILNGLQCDEERVQFGLADLSAADHLSLYHGADIALDPFPFTGSTTTFEALWMGVPVVTLAGDAMVARWSTSMLHVLGLDAFIAATPEDYVRIAAGMASEPLRIAALRAELRGRVAGSPLCNGVGRARQIDRLYRAIWRRWCQTG